MNTEPEDLSREEIVERGRLVHQMTRTRGWQEIVLPLFERKQDSLIQDFREAAEYPSLIGIQQAYNAISNLRASIEQIIADGEDMLSREK